MRTAFWVLFAATLVIYATMVLWTLPVVSAAAGGLAPFDLRLTGYSFAEAQAFVVALSPDGAAFYRFPQHALDLAYPPLMSLTVFFAIDYLARPLGAWRWLLAATALPSAIFDLLENRSVEQMLDAGATGLTAELVASASSWTVLKGQASMVSLTILLLLLAWAGWRRLRRKHT